MSSFVLLRGGSDEQLLCGKWLIRGTGIRASGREKPQATSLKPQGKKIPLHPPFSKGERGGFEYRDEGQAAAWQWQRRDSGFRLREEKEDGRFGG